MKPFNLKEAKKGKPVCTRNGLPVRIVCFDRINNSYPIVALIDRGVKEELVTYTNEGKYSIDDHVNDLVMVSNKKVAYVVMERVSTKLLATYSTIEGAQSYIKEFCSNDNLIIGTLTWEE